MEPKTLASKYAEEAKRRENTLARARDYSSMTLPSIVPYTLADKNVDNRIDTSQSEWQSFGAQAVNNLANRIVMTLFPPSRSFYKLEFSSDMKDELMQANWDTDDLATSLSQIESDSMQYMDEMVPRDLDIRTAKHLIISGNYLHYYPNRDKPAIGIGIDQYVVKRDTRGTLLLCIVEEIKALDSLPEDVQEKVRDTPEGRNLKGSEEVKLYTGAKLDSPGRYVVHQECLGVKIGNEFRVSEANLPFDVLGWNRTDGEDYARGLVEDHAGDMYVVQMLSEAIIKGMVLMADVKYFVKPGSMTDLQHLVTSPTGEFISGNIDDVGVLQLEKYASFDSIQSVLELYQRRLGTAFLLNSEVRRDAERVTAYEIRKDAAELETSLGGIYSHLSLVWQRPRAHRLLNKTLKKSKTGLKLSDFNPKIVTGVEALGRVNELDKIMQFTEMLQMTNTWPKEILTRVKWDKFAQKVSAEISLDTSGFLMSSEEFAQMQQAQQQQAMEMQTMQEASKAAPDIIKQAAGGQNGPSQ